MTSSEIGGMIVIAAVADLVASSWLEAAMVQVTGLLTLTGAV